MRSLEIGSAGFEPRASASQTELEEKLVRPNSDRIWHVGEAFRRGYDVDRVFELSKIDPWFLENIRQIIEMEGDVAAAGKQGGLAGLASAELRRAKRWGFSDKRLATLLGVRSLALFNFYRLALALVFIASSILFGGELVFGSQHPGLFRYAAAAYLLFGLACFAPIRARAPRFELHLGLQVGGDITFLAVLSHASGGIQSGIGLLLLASIAAAGLISRGRLTLFFAALASIGALLEKSFATLVGDAPVSQFFQAGMLSMGYYAVAWVAHTLARYARASERLAHERGVDLANMAQVSRLVIQDMHDGVLVVDGQGVVRQRNTRADQLFGLTPGAGALLAGCAPALAEGFAAWRSGAADEFDLMRIAPANRWCAPSTPPGSPLCRSSAPCSPNWARPSPPRKTASACWNRITWWRAYKNFRILVQLYKRYYPQPFYNYQCK